MNIHDCSANNAAAGAGGAVYNSTSGSLSIIDSIFSSNQASGVGGGIANYGNVSVQGSNFGGNTANYGGGLDNATDAGASILDSVFLNNVAAFWGGGVTNQGTLSMMSSRLDQNYAHNAGNTADGAGFTNESGTATLTDVSITRNEADDRAGGVYVKTGTVNLVRGSITGNTAVNGTAIYFVVGASSWTQMGTIIVGTVMGGPP